MTRSSVTGPQLSSALPVDEWPYLHPRIMLPSSSRRFCLNCRWFAHQAEPNGIPLLCCQLHEGLIIDGEHLTLRCPGWNDELLSKRDQAKQIVWGENATVSPDSGASS